MKRSFRSFTILGVLVLILAGTSGCASTPENHYKSLPQTHTIEIKRMVFSPSEITIRKGDTVVFINHDPLDHDITEVDKKLWSSSPLHPGKSWAKEIMESANYYCSLHVVMKGKIIVQ
jgi:plastocyanin